MANFTVTISPLPPDFVGTPQELANAIVERISIVGDGESFVISDTMPETDQGPWLKGGREWYVWDDNQSTYVPLTITASLEDEVYIGESAPPINGGVAPVWLKMSGAALLGTFVYAGEQDGWVTKSPELVAGAVNSTHIASGAVRTHHIAAKEVTSACIQDSLPVTKLGLGAADAVLSTSVDGTAVEWRSRVFTADKTLDSNTRYYIVSHSLTRIPKWVRVVAVRINSPSSGYSVGDEVELRTGNVMVTVTASTITVAFATSNPIQVYPPDGDVGALESVQEVWPGSVTPKWKLRVYYGE